MKNESESTGNPPPAEGVKAGLDAAGSDPAALQEMFHENVGRVVEAAQDVDREFRTQVQTRPWVVIGVAAGAGFLLGTSLGGRLAGLALKTAVRSAGRALLSGAVAVATEQAVAKFTAPGSSLSCPSIWRSRK